MKALLSSQELHPYHSHFQRSPRPPHHFVVTCLQRNQSPIKRSSTKATRAGAPNYNTEDVTALLDCVEEVEPLGSNHWAIVATRFREWSVDNERPERELDSLRNKFDKLANSKKKTGNPSCPEPVRRAKRIARAIQNKCAAMTLEGSSDEEETEVRAARTSVEEEVGRGAVVSGSTDDNQSEETLGSMKRKRKTAATGMRRTKCRGDDAIVEHIADMSAHIGVISKSLAAETVALSSNESLTKKDVVEIVKNEVRDSMAPTNTMLEQMNNLLQTIVARK